MKNLLIFLLLGWVPNNAFTQPTTELYHITSGSSALGLDWLSIVTGIQMLATTYVLCDFNLLQFYA